VAPPAAGLLAGVALRRLGNPLLLAPIYWDSLMHARDRIQIDLRFSTVKEFVQNVALPLAALTR
jgi:hypothetical protein